MRRVLFARAGVVVSATAKEPSDECDFIGKSNGFGS